MTNVLEAEKLLEATFPEEPIRISLEELGCPGGYIETEKQARLGGSLRTSHRFYRTVWRTNHLQRSVASRSSAVSCNVALGEPNSCLTRKSNNPANHCSLC